MRLKVARTCSALTTPWCSQLAMCWLLMRSVARSSIRPTPWMSGTLEQPHALVHPAHHVAKDALDVVVQLLLALLGCPVGARGDGDGEQAIQKLVRRSGSGVLASSSRCTAATLTWW